MKANRKSVFPSIDATISADQFHSTSVEAQLSSGVENISRTTKVLIIYTGGTIGMKNTTSHGYIPVPGHLQYLLSSMIQFHDPLDTYKAVDSPVMGDFPQDELKLLCKIKNKDVYLPALKTPPSLFNKHIVYSILEYEPLLDSSNLSMNNWSEIAHDISQNYHLFDAFLVLHGTDTMSYTASALSFMLENLGKTVILTGSQIPLSEVRNDAVDNLLGALTICGHYLIPEVCLYFDNKLFRGNRSSKVDTMEFDAFDSPNCQPLVTMGVKINVNWSLVWKPLQLSSFKVHTKMSSDVACLRIFPGLAGKTIEAFIKSGIKGIVLESFGAGNIPSNRPDILQALKDASLNDVIIINCTQCQKGTVLDAYETGKALNGFNVIPGNDMTAECALTKLSYLLGKQLPMDTIRELLKTSLRGELSIPQIDKFAEKSNAITDVLESVLNIKSDNDGNKRYSSQDSLKKALYPSLFITACSLNNVEALIGILDEFKPDTNWLINAFDYDNRTPLHISCTKGHLETVQVLLQHGALVHFKDVFGHTCLFYALKYKYYTIIDLLVNSGARLAMPMMQRKIINKRTTFHIQDIDVIDHRVADMILQAIVEDDMEMVKIIIKCGAEINTGNVEGKTPLHIACGLSRVGIVEYLIKENANKEMMDIYGETPLDVAERMQNLEIIEKMK